MIPIIMGEWEVPFTIYEQSIFEEFEHIDNWAFLIEYLSNNNISLVLLKSRCYPYNEYLGKTIAELEKYPEKFSVFLKDHTRMWDNLKKHIFDTINSIRGYRNLLS